VSQPEPEATEQSLAGLWLAAIRTWLDAVLDAVMAPVRFGAPPDPSAMWKFQGSWNTQVDRIMPVLVSLSRRGWNRTSRDLDVTQAWDPRDPDLAELVQLTRNLLYQVPDRVYREILKSLSVVRNKGESPDRLARRVDSILNINGSVNWPERAKVIARTELNRFQEIGALASARRFQRQSGDTLVKEWETRDDPKVRPGHAEVDNEIKRLGEPFHVGKSSMQQPVDPTAHPDDSVNCRCRLKIRRSRG
jgi:hypothetical protein